MKAITTQEAHAYIARWKLLNEFETAGMRSTSMETRLHQLAGLMAARGLFADDPERKRGVLQVCERWARLRQSPHD